MAHLTRLGLVVLGVVCDGASDNRKIFNLHGCGGKTIHKIVNVYGKEDHPIFFFSDPIVTSSRQYETVFPEESCG